MLFFAALCAQIGLRLGFLAKIARNQTKGAEFMLKGAQKRMIVVKTGDSDIFEEAYFVMRHDTVAKRTDMLAEAEKIIEGCSQKRKKTVVSIQNRTLLFSLLSFLCGGAAGATVFGIISLLV